MENKIEKELKEIWDIKEELYNDFKTSEFNNYYDFIKNEIKDLKYNFYNDKSISRFKRDLVKSE